METKNVVASFPVGNGSVPNLETMSRSRGVTVVAPIGVPGSDAGVVVLRYSIITWLISKVEASMGRSKTTTKPFSSSVPSAA